MKISAFRKQLVSNDADTRKQAIEDLPDIVAQVDSMSEKKVKKLWDALFYCFWLCDMPKDQDELATTLAKLVLMVPPLSAVSFLGAFWQVHCQRWSELDRYRHDKYYMLFRRVIHYAFKWLAQQDWDKEKIADYNTMLHSTPLHVSDPKMPDAIRYHIISLYTVELQKVLDEEQEDQEDDDDTTVSSVPMDLVLEPIRELSKKSTNKRIRKEAEGTLQEAQAKRVKTNSKDDEEASEQEEEEEE